MQGEDRDQRDMILRMEVTMWGDPKSISDAAERSGRQLAELQRSLSYTK